MKRNSLEPVLDLGSSLVASTKEKIESGAARATSTLDQLDDRAPVITVSTKRALRRRRTVLALLLAGLVVLVWWSSRARSRAASSSATSSIAASTEPPPSDVLRQFDVLPKDGRWEIVGPTEGTHRHSTQAEAIHDARQIASDLGGGQIIVHGLDGKPRDTISV